MICESRVHISLLLFFSRDVNVLAKQVREWSSVLGQFLVLKKKEALYFCMLYITVVKNSSIRFNFYFSRFPTIQLRPLMPCFVVSITLPSQGSGSASPVNFHGIIKQSSTRLQ